MGKDGAFDSISINAIGVALQIRINDTTCGMEAYCNLGKHIKLFLVKSSFNKTRNLLRNGKVGGPNVCGYHNATSCLIPNNSSVNPIIQ